jgi:glycosyltransferase involved in cell wall biosynthesis
VTYLIAGKGPDRSRLESKAERLGVRDRVVFTGFVPEEEKADYYRLADRYVMPSRGEGFGLVLLEAMACGIPVVASTADGSREAVLNGRLGLTVDPNDPDAVARSILVSRDALPAPDPEQLRRYFGPEAFNERLHSIFSALLSE